MKYLGFLKGSMKKKTKGCVRACVKKEEKECANVAKY